MGERVLYLERSAIDPKCATITVCRDPNSIELAEGVIAGWIVGNDVILAPEFQLISERIMSDVKYLLEHEE
jgi:hypothetical protein